MDFAQQVKASVNIVSVVREYVRLKKQGPNRWVGLCPFHTEKTPSFSVSENLQIYKCFGCGKGGDVFNFLMEMQGSTFFEALTAVAEQHGIPVPRRSGDHGDEQTRLRAALYRMQEIAQEFFRAQLAAPDGAVAREYLSRRGISAETAAAFGLGYAPPGNRLIAEFRRQGISTSHYEPSGLVGASQSDSSFYEPFRARLTFPIANETGRVIAFAGRALQPDQDPKYLNSKDTEIYTKRAVLYNFHHARQAARQTGRVVLVEGYMDVIGVAGAGIAEVVASCGTALTSQQARMIRRHADTVVVNFDADQAGQSATERSIPVLLQEDLKVRVLALPEAKDPDEFCKLQGSDAYRRLLDAAPDYFTWLADRARLRFDMKTGEGRLAAFKFLVPTIHWLPDKIQRASLADELASYLGLEDRTLALEQIRRAAVERRQAPAAEAFPDPFSKAEKLLIRLLVESGEARKEMLAGVIETAAQEQLPSLTVFDALRAVEAEGVAFQFSALEGRLDERHRLLLSQMVFEKDQPCPSLDEGRRACAALQQKALERRLLAVRREIAEAEKSGDRERCLQLLHARTDVLRRLGLLSGGKAVGA